MLKLKKLIKEHTWDREFGDPLPTFEDVMGKHQVNKLKEDWWDDMDAASQAQYIKDHPGSKQAQQADAGEEEPKAGGSTDTKEFYKDKHWQAVPSPEETQEMTKDMSDEELDDLMANQDKKLQSAKGDEEAEYMQFGGPPQGGGPSSSDYTNAEKERLAGLQAEKDRRAGKEPAKPEPEAEPTDAEKKEKIQGQIDQLKKEYGSVLQSAREAGAEGDGFTQEQMENTAKEIQADIRKLKEKLSSMGRTGNELNQETLTVDGKQYRRISESVEKQPKPKYEFSEFYQRFKK